MITKEIMNKYNNVTLEGYIAYDPRIKTTPKGFTVGEVKMKCPSGKNGTSSCFIDVVIWDKNILKAIEQARQGDYARVTGELRSSSWQTPTGESRTKHSVNSETFNIIHGKQEEAFE